MRRTLTYTMAAVLGLVLAIVFVASTGCGGNHKPSPSPSPTPTAAQKPELSYSLVRGGHVQAAQQVVKTSYEVSWPSFFSLPEVHAQAVTTVKVAQNWEGECFSSPMQPGPLSFSLFGVGQTSDDTCSHEFRPNDDGSGTAANAPSGKVVFGDGVLSNLVVSTERGTSIVSGTTVKVFVKRGETTQDTGISCALPVGGDELACSSTATFAALSGDHVVVVVVLGDGDRLVNLSAAFTKALPLQ